MLELSDWRESIPLAARLTPYDTMEIGLVAELGRGVYLCAGRAGAAGATPTLTALRRQVKVSN